MHHSISLQRRARHAAIHRDNMGQLQNCYYVLLILLSRPTVSTYNALRCKFSKSKSSKKILESFPVSTVVGLYRQQWWKQDQNVKTKTKIKTKTIRSRPTPRPIKQQQDYITKKLFCCNKHVCYQKIALCKKRQEVIWWPVTFGTVSALIARKNTGVYYISALSCHTAPVGHNSVLSKTKSIRPRLRPRPRPVWDQSCHKTAVSDPKTDRQGIHLPNLPLKFQPLPRVPRLLVLAVCGACIASLCILIRLQLAYVRF